MDEKRLTVIENTKTDVEVKVKKDIKPSRQTNPIAKKFVEFHHEQLDKFSVKDLFKK